MPNSKFTGYYVTKEKHVMLLDNIEGGSADIGMDRENNMIYAPIIFGNKVVCYKLVTD